MYEEWIKLRNSLWDDPRVVSLANELSANLDGLLPKQKHLFSLDFLKCAVLGALFRTWSVADQHSRDGILRHYTPGVLDDMLGMRGFFSFATALMRVNWLEFENGNLVIPRFSEHNSQSAKARHENTARQRRARVARLSRSGHENVAPIEGEGETEQEKIHRNDESCPEPVEDDHSGPPVLVFQTVGKGPKEWSLTEAKVAEYQESFPGVDVLAECRKARQWIIDNPTKRKTARGMPAFLTRWLGRVQNSGRAGAGKDAPPETPAAKAERLARERARRGADLVPPQISPEEAERLRSQIDSLRRKG